MVGRAHHNHVDVLAIQNLAEVLIGLRFSVRRREPLLQVRFVHVADCGDLDVRLTLEVLQIADALAAGADHAHAHAVIGAQYVCRSAEIAMPALTVVTPARLRKSRRFTMSVMRGSLAALEQAGIVYNRSHLLGLSAIGARGKEGDVERGVATSAMSGTVSSVC